MSPDSAWEGRTRSVPKTIDPLHIFNIFFMRHLLLILVAIFATSCADDSWKAELEAIKTELANQKALIEALQNNASITGIEQGNDSYTIHFSDGQSITLTNGQTPIITIGENGNWFINGEDTGKPSQGENGENGTDGADGTDGVDGQTPTIEIGSNGNWYINGTDTGVRAEGTNGMDAPHIINILEISNSYYFYFSDGSITIIHRTPSNNQPNIKNLFNPRKAEFINGYKFVRSEYIPIAEGESLTASTNTTLWQTTCALYDQNGNILNDTKINIKDNRKSVTLNWTNGASFARFEFRSITDLNQIEKGTIATNYERYTEDRSQLKRLSFPSFIPLLTNYTYSIFTDNIIYKTANTESGFYIDNWPIYNDRFTINQSETGNVTKKFRIYQNNQVDNAGELNFTFLNPNDYAGQTINLLTIGDSYGGKGLFIEAIIEKMKAFNIHINLLGTHNKIETRKSESLSGGSLARYVLTPSGDGAVITATNIETDSDIPQSTYGSPTYQDENGTIWNIIGNRKMPDGSLRLRLGRWNGSGEWGQELPASGKLIKQSIPGSGKAEITYNQGTSCPYNPFWNPDTNQLDFKYYINYWEFENPDIIILQFTWNDLPKFATTAQCETFASNLKIVVERIHEQLPACKVIFSIEPAGAILSNQGTYFIDGSHYTRLTLNEVLQQQFDNEAYPYLFIAPSYAFVDRRNSFNTTTDNPNDNYPNDEIEYSTDGVHCNTQGMQQIADCLIPYIIYQ